VTVRSSTSAEVAVLVLSYNQRDLTLRLLSSLRASSPGSVRTLLWDNGSTDGTVEAVASAFPDVVTHRHESNLGVAGGRNAAAALATAEWSPTHLLFLDNDLELEPGFVSSLLRVFDEDPRVGQTQAKLRLMDDRTRLNDGGGCTINFLTGQTVPVGYGEVDRGQHDVVRPCISCGGAMMVRSDVFRELGGFDMVFNPFGPEDLDFSLRLQSAGYSSLFVPSAVAYHLVSHTFGAGYSEDYARHKARHWLTFLGRHGTLAQKLGFYLLGAPYMALRVAAREGRRGNLGALRGTVMGLFDKLGNR
jgi:GT2 family glycosyltransferase